MYKIGVGSSETTRKAPFRPPPPIPVFEDPIRTLPYRLPYLHPYGGEGEVFASALLRFCAEEGEEA